MQKVRVAVIVLVGGTVRRIELMMLGANRLILADALQKVKMAARVLCTSQLQVCTQHV